MPDLTSLSATVHGLVQGVNFRYFVLRHARELGLTGYARNLPTGTSVEVRAEGERGTLEQLIRHLKVGPHAAMVEKVEVSWSEYKAAFSRFEVRF